MKYLYTLLLLTISITAYTQNNEEAKSFEYKLEEFRFSLYEELDKVADENIMNFQFDEKDSLVLMINDFCSKYSKEIIEYRGFLLNKYSDRSMPDLDNYNKVDINSELMIQTIKGNIPLTDLMLINPFVLMDLFKNMYASRKSVQDLAKDNIKSQIAMPLISAKKINSTQWEIMENSYSKIHKFTYDVEKGEMLSFEVFERKKKE